MVPCLSIGLRPQYELVWGFPYESCVVRGHLDFLRVRVLNIGGGCSCHVLAQSFDGGDMVDSKQQLDQGVAFGHLSTCSDIHSSYRE